MERGRAQEFIPGHAANGETQTTYDVTIYRRTPEDIDDSLQQNGLDIVSHRLFVPKPNVDVAYQCGFVVAKSVLHGGETEG